MKYLHPEAEEAVWLAQLAQYTTDFKKNLAEKGRLPAAFCRFYLEKGMHDHDLLSIEIRRRHTWKEKQFDVCMHWKSDAQVYTLTFQAVSRLEINFSPFGTLPDFIAGEFLARDEKTLSCEMRLFSDFRLYLEHRRLQYRLLWR